MNQVDKSASICSLSFPEKYIFSCFDLTLHVKTVTSLTKTKSWTWIKNKLYSTLNIFLKSVYVSSYFQSNAIPWKWDSLIFLIDNSHWNGLIYFRIIFILESNTRIKHMFRLLQRNMSDKDINHFTIRTITKFWIFVTKMKLLPSSFQIFQATENQINSTLGEVYNVSISWVIDR